MANTTYNKVIYHGKTLIDLTKDTVTSDKLLAGSTAHDKSGKKITGTFLSSMPSTFEIDFALQDDAGNNLLDNAGSSLISQCIYKR